LTGMLCIIINLDSQWRIFVLLIIIFVVSFDIEIYLAILFIIDVKVSYFFITDLR
jgi:hypothetical protein